MGRASAERMAAVSMSHLGQPLLKDPLCISPVRSLQKGEPVEQPSLNHWQPWQENDTDRGAYRDHVLARIAGSQLHSPSGGVGR